MQARNIDSEHEFSIKLIPVLRMNHEEHVREACAKVGAISVVVSGQVKISNFVSIFSHTILKK